MSNSKFTSNEIKMLKEINDHQRQYRRSNKSTLKRALTSEQVEEMTSDINGLPKDSDKNVKKNRSNMFIIVFKIQDTSDKFVLSQNKNAIDSIKEKLINNIRKVSDRIFAFQENLYIAIIPTMQVEVDTIEEIVARLNSVVVTELRKYNIKSSESVDKNKVIVIELQKMVSAETLVLNTRKLFELPILPQQKVTIDIDDETLVFTRSAEFTSEKFIALVAK
jgi:hypothetical protein